MLVRELLHAVQYHRATSAHVRCAERGSNKCVGVRFRGRRTPRTGRKTLTQAPTSRLQTESVMRKVPVLFAMDELTDGGAALPEDAFLVRFYVSMDSRLTFLAAIPDPTERVTRPPSLGESYINRLLEFIWQVMGPSQEPDSCKPLRQEEDRRFHHLNPIPSLNPKP